MPGNLVHRVYTVLDSVAVECIFISEPKMKNSLITRQWERSQVCTNSKNLLHMRQLEESNLFYNFEAITGPFFFETLQAIVLQKKGVAVSYKLFQSLMRCGRKLNALLSSLQKQWIETTGRKFDRRAVQQLFKKGSLCD